jgi:hypothetical protein
MKTLITTSFRFSPAALGLALCLAASSATAGNLWFDSNGTTAGYGGSGSWDGANWATASGGAKATGSWVSGSFAEFLASGTSTVTVNASEVNAGLYVNATSATLNVNDAGNGTGSLSLSGTAAFLLGGSYTETMNINVPITGGGVLAPEGGGSVYLNKANNFTGGTALGDSGNTLTYFNNSSAFGSGGISFNRTGNWSTLLGQGGSTLTLANNFSTVLANTGPSTGINFATDPNTPVVSSGTWSLGTVNLVLKNSGGSTSPLTLSGAISGSGALTVTANNPNGKVILSAASPGYTGATTVAGTGYSYAGVPAGAAGYLQFGIANAIANTTGMTLAGGTLNPGGFNQVMSGATLGLTASSTIDFTSGAAELDFANSSGVAWTSGQVLNLIDWTTGVDELRFGTDATGLTLAQLNEIEFDGVSGLARLDVNGYLVPEPSTAILGLLGGLALVRVARRRTA